jgi:hypothetical protein
MKRFLLIFFLSVWSSQFCAAQVTDDFADGDFTANPVWSGSSALWQVNPQFQLQSNASVAGNAFLSTPSTPIANTEWQAFVKLSFAGSSSNYARFYLAADQSDLSSPTLNGYYLQFGEAGSSDAVELFRQNGTTMTSIARATDGQIAAAFTIKVKVTVDNAGLWSLYVDPTASSGYSLEDTGNDLTISSSSFMGVFATYTVSNISGFYFDDFYVGPPIFDTTPPLLISATPINANQVDVLFNEALDAVSANLAGNYNINNGINIQSAQLDGTNPALVHLNLLTALTNNTNYQLTVNNVSDLALNPIANNSLSNFTYAVPGTALWNDVIINEIMADPSPQVGLPNVEFVEILNRSNQSFDLTGWQLSDGASNATFPNLNILPGEYYILCATSSVSLFTGNVVGLPSFPSINNAAENLYLRNASLQAIDSLSFDLTWYHDPLKEDGGWTMEKINPNLENICSGGNNWTASVDVSGGTPGSANSVLSVIPDVNAPTILSSGAPQNNQLSICFSEALSPLALQQPTAYVGSGGIGAAVSASVSQNNTCVLLQFANAFTPGSSYTISLPVLTDCSGNLLASTQINFTFFQAQQFDVVINEIHADPTPQVGLPAFEFVEIYNRTAYNLDMNGWQLKIGSSTLPLQAISLPADSFMILTTSAAATDFSSYGIVNVLNGMSSTALTNAGTSIQLLDQNSNLIHRVVYSDTWYNDVAKKDGGWTLEMIDPANPCNGQNNWSASISADGGTPGRINSINASNPDNTAPAIASTRVVNNNQLEVTFTEPVFNAASLAVGDFSVNNGIGNPTLLSPIGNPVSAVVLTFAGSFTINQIYTLSLSAVLSDCSANNSTGVLSSIFAQYIPQPFDIVIHEIMPDPDPAVALPSAEYLELYNRTAFPVNTYNWTMSYGGTVKALPSAVIAPNGYLILSTTTAAFDFSSFGNTAGVVGLSSSSLTNSGNDLILRDSIGTILHALSYSDQWYADAGKISGGWSLEMIDANNPCAGSNNWKASVAALGGTPGQANSVAASNPDAVAPYIVSVCPLSGNVMEVFFSETLDSTNLANLNAYSINNGIGNPTSVLLTPPYFNSVKLTFPVTFSANVLYTMSFSGVASDCAGNSLSNASADFYLGVVQPYEVVINEIMCDPDPAVALAPVEYIELHNKKDVPVSLNGFSISIGSSNNSLSCVTIPAKGFLLIVPENTNISDDDFRTAYKLNGFSSLSNTGGTISLADQFGKIISSVTYAFDWYNNSAKEDGGWSLEQIDPLNPCGGKNNWAASKDVRGGTPGKANSILGSNPDQKLPSVWRVGIIDAQNIKLHFTEPLQVISMLNLSTYNIDNSIGQPIAVVPQIPDYSTILLQLGQPLQKGVVYSISVTNSVKDCAGNLLSETNTAKFGLPDSIVAGDLVINEVLFNPKEGGSDYVEIYNKSGKVLELNGLRLSNIDADNGQITNADPVVGESYLLLPYGYFAISEDIEAVKLQYYSPNPQGFVVAESLPSMSTTAGSVALSTRSGDILDQLVYTDDMHFPLIIDQKGVSLERINPLRPSDDVENWNSASQASGFGTPAYRNSQNVELPEGNDQFNFSSEIFSPDNDGFQDVLQVSYLFTEPGNVLTVRVMDARGRLVKTLLNNYLAGTSGTFSWDGINEDNVKGEIGIYVLLLEYFRADGKTVKTKRSFVLAGKI